MAFLTRPRRRPAVAFRVFSGDRRHAERVLPTCERPMPRSAASDGVAFSDAMSGAGVTPTIGVCEDDDELRGMLRDALRARGLRPCAPPPPARRRCARSPPTPPDVLVLDIGLPDADGRDVCQALRARGVDGPGAVPHRAGRAHRPAQRLPRRRRRLPDQAVRARRAARPRPRAAAARAAAATPAAPSRRSCSTRRAHAIAHGGARACR